MFRKFILLWYNFNIKITLYNSVNVKLFNSQLNKLKSAITKSKIGIILRLSSNMIANTNDKTNFHINYY